MPIGRYENPDIRGLRSKRRAGTSATWPIDREIAWVADRQGGHVHREQLRDLGLSASGIDRRVAIGRLHRVGRQTFAVGTGRPDRLARLHAALLMAGDGVLLSHQAAGGEIGLLSQGRGPIDLTLERSHRPLPGIRFHRAHLAADEVIVVDGLPMTSVGRTLFDLAGSIDEFTFRRAVKDATVRHLDCTPSLPTLLDRYPRRPGASLIRAVISEWTWPSGVVPTDGDERFLKLVRRGGFPMPSFRHGIALAEGWVEVDFAWPDLRIVVEVDSSFHEVDVSLETDHGRDQDLLAEGWSVFRVTWRQLRYEPERVLLRFRAFFDRALRQPRYPRLL